ncbi:MAG: hypothetical protein IJQ14_00100 [Bacteroidales bacterium]|jgi:hypothetical protein|nr:hypothetical protein [Bacteroidales bacterium]
MGNRFREKVTEEGLEEPVLQEEKPVAEEPVAEEEPTAAEAPKKGKGGRAAKGVAKVLGGDLLADKVVLKQIPLLLLCLLFLLLIVANRYKVESLSREKQASEERINYLREHRIQMQKQYQQSIKISQIAEDLREQGVGITAGPPYEL